MRQQLAALLVSALMIPRLVSGQAVLPGDRVRLSHPGEGTRTGTVVALTADTLEVRFEGRTEPAHLPLAQLTRLDVSRGREPGKRSGAGVGFLLGAAIGGIGGAVSSTDCSANDFCAGPGPSALMGALVLGGVGALIGRGYYMAPFEKWEPVSLERRRVSLVAPSGSNKRGVGLRIAF